MENVVHAFFLQELDFVSEFCARVGDDAGVQIAGGPDAIDCHFGVGESVGDGACGLDFGEAHGFAIGGVGEHDAHATLVQVAHSIGIHFEHHNGDRGAVHGFVQGLADRSVSADDDVILQRLHLRFDGEIVGATSPFEPTELSNFFGNRSGSSHEGGDEGHRDGGASEQNLLELCRDASESGGAIEEDEGELTATGKRGSGEECLAEAQTHAPGDESDHYTFHQKEAGDAKADDPPRALDDFQIDHETDGDEEDGEKEVFEWKDIGQHAVRVNGLADNQAGCEGSEREAEPEPICASGNEGAESDDGDGKELAAPAGRHGMEQVGHHKAAESPAEGEEEDSF